MVTEGTTMQFAIWCEGYAATGESGTATLIGRAFGKTFKEAYENFAERDKGFKNLFNPDRMTYWGCRLFTNQADARKSFGL